MLHLSGHEDRGLAAPLLLVVHDDTEVRASLVGALAERFGAHYELEAHCTAEEALGALRGHAAEGRDIAVIFTTDTPRCGGAEFFAAAHELHPYARRVLLVGRGEWKNLHPAVRAMRSGQADAYVFIPWGPPERWLYLPVSEILADWEASQEPRYRAMEIIGREWEPRTQALRTILKRAGIPFGFHPAGSSQAAEILGPAGIDDSTLPVLALRSGKVLVNPSLEEVATVLGFATEPHDGICDVAIVGSGPAGLAAAVYAASEGLATTVIEAEVVGGQAGTSSRIRNYLGFPNGLSGTDLTNRAIEQAWFFGARLVLSKAATALRPAGDEHVVELSGGAEVRARTIVIATGVMWRRLEVPSLDRFLGAGVFYGADASDAAVVVGAHVYIVGAGNSAGQAAVHARSAASVTLLARGPRLNENMSDYLVQQLAETANIHVRTETEVVDGHGGGHLTSLTLRNATAATTEEVSADALYVMIGARPHTGWLEDAVARDERGFVLTGEAVAARHEHPWPLERRPLLVETSRPGVFAAGDVRHGSVKRVASAVGDGSIAIQLAHLRLAELA